MLIGYARVSTEDQDLTLQRSAFKDIGCERIYEEKVTGARRTRPQLARMLDQLRAGDVVVVSRLDRLARSTRDLLEIAEQLNEAEAGLRSLREPWADTTTPAGRMVLTVFAGIAEFERELIQERIRSGIAAAKARGKRLGRQFGQRPKSDRLAPKVLALIRQGRSYRLIGREVGLSKNTVADIVKRSRLTRNVLVEATSSAGSPP